ncbi:hypothetical protein C8R46DRAFT_1222349 [Mycena filopes]|nr:hypothetical protein C8R46DRAFT_1222349 [Mycena filopes]
MSSPPSPRHTYPRHRHNTADIDLDLDIASSRPSFLTYSWPPSNPHPPRTLSNLLPLRGAAEFLGFFFAARLIASWKLWKFSFRCAALVTPTATKIFFAARPGVSELVPGKGHPEGPKIVKFSRDQGIKSQISTGVRGTHLLLINAVVYAVVYGVTASISSLFHDTYPWLSETKLGLCFLTVEAA